MSGGGVRASTVRTSTSAPPPSAGPASIRKSTDSPKTAP